MYKRLMVACLLAAMAAPGWAFTVRTFYQDTAEPLLEGDERQTVTVTLERDPGDGPGFCIVFVDVEAGPFRTPIANEAVPNVDYVPGTFSVELALEGEETLATTTFDVVVIDNEVPEPTRFFAARVVGVQDDCSDPIQFDANEDAPIPIFDDDGFAPGEPAFGNLPQSVLENAGAATIIVNRVNGTDGTLVVTFATEDGTAVAGTDYTAVSGTLTWTDGDATPRQFEIPIIDNDLVDGDRTLTVTLSSETRVNGVVSETLTILDDEGLAVVEFSVVDLQVTEDAGTVTATIARLGPTEGAVSVDFATEDGTATAGEDYEAVSGTLTWADGDGTDRTIEVTLIPGQIGPDGENFSIVLFNATGNAVLGENSILNVTIGQAPPDRDIEGIAILTPNQRALARWFDQTCPRLAEETALTADQSDLLAICGLVRGQGATDDEVRRALDAINPEELFAAASGSLRLTVAQHGNLSQRLNALRSGATGIDLSGLNLEINGQQIAGRALQEIFDRIVGGGASADEATWGRWGMFLNGRFSTGKKNETANEGGFDYDLYNVTLGVDYRIRQNLIFGVAAGFGGVDSDYRGNRGDLKIDSWTASAFLTYFANDTFYADLLATYGENDYDSRRRIQFDIGGESIDRTARGSTDGRQFSVGGGFGWDFSRNAWTYGPHGGFYYYDVDVDSFNERGANGLDLAIGRQNVKSMTANAGGHVSYAILTGWGVLVPNARIDWVRELEDGSESLSFRFINDPFTADPNDPSPTITLRSDKPDSSYYVWSVGVSAQFVYGISGFVSYQTYGSYSSYTINEWNGGLRWEKTF
jgi:outer membrane autotransporter protein